MAFFISFLQSLNAFDPIVFTFLPIVTFFSFFLFPIYSTSPPITFPEDFLTLIILYLSLEYVVSIVPFFSTVLFCLFVTLLVLADVLLFLFSLLFILFEVTSFELLEFLLFVFLLFEFLLFDIESFDDELFVLSGLFKSEF